MTLKTYQFKVEVDKIYELKKIGYKGADDGYGIFVNGAGTIKVYASELLPALKTDMIEVNTGVVGYKEFKANVPRYVYFEVESGTIDDIILQFLKPTEIV
jgi:hypothetical protein